MALSGMDIFKLLPKTNCKECGSPSCLAFAMKIAGGKGELCQCTQLSEEASRALEELMEPPTLSVKVKRGERSFTAGGEKVIYRHDESFYNPTAIGVEIPDRLSDEDLKENISQAESLSFDRAGQIIQIDFIAAEDKEKSSGFADYAKKIYDNTKLPVAFKTKNTDAVAQILDWPEKEGVILITGMENAKKNIEKLKTLQAFGIIVGTAAEAEPAGKLFREHGIKNGFIALDFTNPCKLVNTLYKIRYESLIIKNRNMSYPAFVWPQGPDMDIQDAAAAVMKYAGAVVTKSSSADDILPVLTLRQNIFTDPRRPIQVEAKIYEAGDVTPESPLLVTTNFSLTYFTVFQEIEASRIPTRLLIVDTDGTSVLTAWSADRFNAKTILAAVEKSGIGSIVKNKELIIPGYVDMLASDIEEISDWKVITGPKEASGIPEFLRKYSAKAINI